MIVYVTALSSVPGHFAAVMDGTTIVPKTRQPLLDASRVLLTSENSTHTIGMTHSGSTAIALKGIIGQCAKLTVAEGPSGPVFRRWEPIQQPATSVLASCS